MFCKTAVSFEFGCVAGDSGPAKLPLPAIETAIEEPALGWRLCRLSENVMILVDGLPESEPKDRWSRILKHMHGILLRRLGKKRVVYLIRQLKGINEQEPSWHSNINLVTGVSANWLKETFSSGETERTCTIAGTA